MTKTKNQSASPLPVEKTKVVSNQLTFLQAMERLMSGAKIRRQEWSDKEEYCLLKNDFLMIHRGDAFHGWIVSEGDMLAIDWVIIK